MNAEKRFWSKVRFSPGDGCFTWGAATNKFGYGVFKHAGTTRAHRVVWMFVHNEMPVLDVLHKCDNPTCVRPDHLFLGTDLDNTRDMIRKGRKAVARGVHHGSSKLTPQLVEAARLAHSCGVSIRALARSHQVSKTTMAYAVSGRTWRVQTRMEDDE